MGLIEYQRKRDFKATPEPAGRVARKKGWSYVIQKHAARRLHYDFRLELDGVLKSWAVPKGPSLDPAEKRLAVQVEDHPLEYGRFEGVIPKGEYGGGTVMLWDRGYWEPVGDAHEGYRQGKLKFKLHGQKLRGGWVLVRRAAARNGGAGEKNWLLIKQRDEHAKPVAAGDILKEEHSVASGRDISEIAAAQDRVWQTGRGTDGKSKPPAMPRKRPSPPAAPRVAHLGGVKAGKLPPSIKPQMATLTEKALDGDDWLHEIKLDGYRMLCRIDKRNVEFISRNQKNWTDRFEFLVPAAKKLPVKQALLDGEIVAIKPDGTSDFQSLQNAYREGRLQNVYYYVFDLLHYNGYSLLRVPLEERKRLLSEIVSVVPDQRAIRLSDHIVGDGPRVFQQACKMGLEGVISKRRQGTYAPGRGYDWLKIKCVHGEEFIVGGYTPPAGSRAGFGALLLGYYEGEKLIFAGKVGTGFNQRTLSDLLARLTPLRQSESPFDNLRGGTGPARHAQWVKPQLVAEIQFTNWTRDRLLRHPSFLGLREDKAAREVTREQPVPVAEAVRKSGAKAAQVQKKKHAGISRQRPAKAATSRRSPKKLSTRVPEV